MFFTWQYNKKPQKAVCFQKNDIEIAINVLVDNPELMAEKCMR